MTRAVDRRSSKLGRKIVEKFLEEEGDR